MKEFNLDAALNGEPVMLRNGKRLTLVIKRLITMFLITVEKSNFHYMVILLKRVT